MDAQLTWMKSPEAKKIATSAQEKAWKEFQQQFPRADRSKFEIQSNFAKHTATAEVFFKGSSGVSTSVFGSDRRYWSPQMKPAPGVADVDGFPYQLLPLKTKKLLSIPTVNFTEAVPSLKKIFNNPFEIYVTPDSLFVVKFREIFQQTRIRHTSAAESKRWLSGPNMKYWPQQLNFAVFCATQGCGISREVFDSGVTLPEQIRAFYRFHVYFTVRRILFQMGGIQSVSALPSVPTFNPSGNKYDVASYKRICAEFGIAPISDFRFTGGKNHGLGNVYIGVTGHGPMKTGTAWPGGYYKFSDEGGKQQTETCFILLSPTMYRSTTGSHRTNQLT